VRDTERFRKGVGRFLGLLKGRNGCEMGGRREVDGEKRERGGRDGETVKVAKGVV
jgi:hypothetical protein